MIAALIKKELRLANRSRRVHLAAIGMLVLAFIAIGSGIVEHKAQLEAHRALTQYSDVSFKTQKAAHPHQIAHNGYVVSRPPAPLGFLDGGVETAYGTHVRLDAHRTRSLQGARTSELARGPGAGRFDLGLLLAVFAPALVFLLGYDQIASEKTRGTLNMLRVAGVRTGPLVAAKLAGLSMRVLIAIVCPAIAAILVADMALDDVPIDRLAIWLLVHVLALFVWMLIVLITSAIARTSQGALLLGFTVWGVLALCVPPFAGGLAVAMRPLPPLGEEMVRAEKWAASAHAQNDALKVLALADIKRRHPEWNGIGALPEVLDAVMLRLADAEVAQKVAHLLDRMEADEDAQQSLATLASMISPSGLASLASSAIAGSDIVHMRATWRYYEAYRVSLMAWFNDWWAKNGTGGFDAFATDRSFGAFQDAPRLVTPVFDLSFALASAALPLALLLLAGLLMLVALAAAVRLALAPRARAARSPASADVGMGALP
jgi:hypothetical protein